MRLELEPSRSIPTDYAYAHRLRVRFAETDAMGIVHHSRYLPYLEEARVEYLRHLGHPYTELRAEGVDYAVLEAFVQYRQPLRFDDEVRCTSALGAATRATFQMAYLLTVDERGAGHCGHRARLRERRRPAGADAGLAARPRPRTDACQRFLRCYSRCNVPIATGAR